MNRITGAVKFFKKDKGFGFIKPSDGGKDIFFHVSELPEGVKDIQPDERVSFQIGQSKKGPAAQNIEFAA